jgi:hypothetical protein
MRPGYFAQTYYPVSYLQEDFWPDSIYREVGTIFLLQSMAWMLLYDRSFSNSWEIRALAEEDISYRVFNSLIRRLAWNATTGKGLQAHWLLDTDSPRITLV